MFTRDKSKNLKTTKIKHLNLIVLSTVQLNLINELRNNIIHNNKNISLSFVFQ